MMYFVFMLLEDSFVNKSTNYIKVFVMMYIPFSPEK